MYQSGAVQRVVGAFVSQLKMRQATQFFIDERQQGIERAAVPAAPILQKPRDLVRRLGFHGNPSARASLAA
jgi:hypothetical protein